ncbi:MAG: hypothetical protein ACHP65_04600 [Legionellales bacterium]
MPFYTPTKAQPKQNSLIVCAGTVTCAQVSGMGSGFVVFKNQFRSNVSCNDHAGGWNNELQILLDQYHAQAASMPPYVRIAEQDGYIGGVATVPYFSGNKGLSFDEYLNMGAREEAFRSQYKLAVKQAILDAKELGRPLFLQPLGIGVYGWKPEAAAKLFAEAIMEADPKDEVDLTIPIFDPAPNSNDARFKTALAVEMQPHGRQAAEKKMASDPKNEVDLTTPILAPAANSNDARVKTAVAVEIQPHGRQAAEKKAVVVAPVTESPKADPVKLPEQSKLSVDQPSASKPVLCTILDELISNIEHKNGGRWTSGSNSKKIQLLRDLKTSIETEKQVTGTVQAQYVQKIMDVCYIKRHALHFWATPESVTEYTKLLKQQNIALPSEKTAHGNVI